MKTQNCYGLFVLSFFKVTDCMGYVCVKCLLWLWLPAGPRGGPSPELLASLQTLGEHSDHALLPQSLHQVCVCVSCPIEELAFQCCSWLKQCS